MGPKIREKIYIVGDYLDSIWNKRRENDVDNTDYKFEKAVRSAVDEQRTKRREAGEGNGPFRCPECRRPPVEKTKTFGCQYCGIEYRRYFALKLHEGKCAGRWPRGSATKKQKIYE